MNDGTTTTRLHGRDDDRDRRASGIPREVVLRFGDVGTTVVVADLDDEPKDADVPTHEAIRDGGRITEFVETDVTDRDQLQSLVKLPANLTVWT